VHAAVETPLIFVQAPGSNSCPYRAALQVAAISLCLELIISPEPGRGYLAISVACRFSLIPMLKLTDRRRPSRGVRRS